MLHLLHRLLIQPIFKLFDANGACKHVMVELAQAVFFEIVFDLVVFEAHFQQLIHEFLFQNLEEIWGFFGFLVAAD